LTFSRGLVSTVLICGVAYRWRSKEAPRDVRGDVRPAAAKREEAGRARRGMERANTILNYFPIGDWNWNWKEIEGTRKVVGLLFGALLLVTGDVDSRAQAG
jgi:hypothetical protein